VVKAEHGELRGRGKRWIEEEIARLNPVDDSEAIVLLSANRLLPRFGAAMVLNLLYCLGFLRVSGQLEGARAVDRDGSGKVHRHGDRRAEDTVLHFTTWIQYGPTSEKGLALLQGVKRMHDHYAKQYSFSNETMVHTIALFTVQFEHMFRLVGAKGYSQIEKEAQVTHWRAIGEQLGTREMPETWEGMERFLEWYENSPEWFGPTPEGYRCSAALIGQFSDRWLPRGFRWAGRLLLLSLVEDHVLRVLGQGKPARPIVWLVRRIVRTVMLVNQRLLPERRQLIDPSALLYSRREAVSA
jgi:hypothetical protein